MAILNYTDDELANMIATATARTEVAYPLDNTDYVASDAQVWHSTRSHGIFSADSELLVNASGGMNVTLGIGRAFLKPDIFLCCVYANKQDKVLPIDRADGTLNRIDRLVIRWDFMTETVTAQIKKGALAMTPKPPSLQRDANAWELARADITVKAGVLEITQADIKDLSGDETLCGVMRDDVTKIPTEQLYIEYNAWFNALKADSQKEFLEWFDTIKDLLDENAAGNLISEIEKFGLKLLSNRKEIIDIKLKLSEEKVIDFLNKTGVGFYDLFEHLDYVDTDLTTASVNVAENEVIFNDNKLLKMKEQQFDNFNNLELAIYDKDREFINTIEYSANNQIEVLIPPSSINVGDKYVYNNEIYTVSTVSKG